MRIRITATGTVPLTATGTVPLTATVIRPTTAMPIAIRRTTATETGRISATTARVTDERAAATDRGAREGKPRARLIARSRMRSYPLRRSSRGRFTLAVPGGPGN